jgi:hypothetical protein
MNTALPVLRIIPGLLLMGRGLQQLVPPAAHRRCGTRRSSRNGGFESLGIRLASSTNTPSSNAPSRRT